MSTTVACSLGCFDTSSFVLGAMIAHPKYPAARVRFVLAMHSIPFAEVIDWGGRTWDKVPGFCFTCGHDLNNGTDHATCRGTA